MNSTVVIPTIGRGTLSNSVASALREKFEVIVVGDGDVDIPEFSSPKVKVIKLGRRWGHYGAMAYNVGACLAKTEFIISLADDDELGPDFREVLDETLRQRPLIDIWIPQIIFNDETVLCNPENGYILGNMGAPIYRCSVLTQVPFKLKMGQNIELDPDPDCIDFYHLSDCLKAGYRLDWQLKLNYMVRPKMSRKRGWGQIEFPNEIPLV